MKRTVEDGDVGEIRQRAAGLLDRGQRGRVVQGRELDGGLEAAQDVVVDEDRVAEARAAVDDAVRDRGDIRRRGVEGRDGVRRVVRLDDRELQARRAGVDD